MGLLVLTLIAGCAQGEGKAITVFAGSASKPPLDEAGLAFEKATGVKVYFNYGGSGTVLSQMKLSDFKVRVLDEKIGTAAKVRVLIQSQDDKETWDTIGVHENIIEASWEALVDSIEYKLLKDSK